MEMQCTTSTDLSFTNHRRPLRESLTYPHAACPKAGLSCSQLRIPAVDGVAAVEDPLERSWMAMICKRLPQSYSLSRSVKLRAGSRTIT